LPAGYQGRSVDAERRNMAREHFEDTLAGKAGRPFTGALRKPMAQAL
jgi:hypothetical protein